MDVTTVTEHTPEVSYSIYGLSVIPS